MKSATRVSQPTSIIGRRSDFGFTLLEMMVASTIFMIAALITASLLVSVVRAQRHAHAVGGLLDNIRFGLDSATKGMLVGDSYRCVGETEYMPPALPDPETLDKGVYGSGAGNNFGDCSANSRNILLFKSLGNLIVAYRFNAGGHALERSVENGPFVAVTAPGVLIDDIDFYLSGILANDAEQPKISVIVRSRVSPQAGQFIPLNISTTISQRKIDT